MTVRALIAEGKNRLLSHQISDADVDAWLLFQYVTGMSRAEFFMHTEDLADAEVTTRYLAYIEQRCAHIPLQYITHNQNFMGFDFYVDERVLIPRQDTEVLVETACGYLKPGARVLDMCTGSGCILISLALLAKLQEGIGVDLSEGALDVAKMNATRLGCQQISFIQSDLFQSVSTVTYAGYFDMIVSNPPYIASEEVLKLMPEVQDHEPVMALDGDTDGLKFYREIVLQTVHYLKKGGRLIFEIGFDQGEAVSELMQSAGFCDVRVIQDLAGLDRVVSGIYM